MSNGLRDHMAGNLIEQRDWWLEMKGDSKAARAHITTTYNAQIERWRSDEPMPVSAGELPDWARGGIHPNTAAVVLADGTIEVVERGVGERAPVVELDARRPKRLT